MSNKPIAFLVTPEGLKVHKIKLIQGNFFVIKPYGVFQLDISKRIPYKKQTCYLYDSRNANPLDLKVIKEIEDFAKRNGLHKIKRKDLSHGEKLRRAFSMTRKGKTEKDISIAVREDILTEVNAEKEKIVLEVDGILKGQCNCQCHHNQKSEFRT